MADEALIVEVYSGTSSGAEEGLTGEANLGEVPGTGGSLAGTANSETNDRRNTNRKLFSQEQIPEQAERRQNQPTPEQVQE